MLDDALDKQSLEIEELISSSINSHLSTLRTSSIGIVTKYDEEKGTVDVQPALMRKMTGLEPRKMAIIKNCPVHFYGAGGFVITFKPKPGDVCDLIFNERSLDKWKLSGGVVDPASPRRHDATDAKAYFGINPYTDVIPNIEEGMDIRTRDGSTGVLVKPGSIELRIGGVVVAILASSGIEFTVPVTGPEGTFGGTVVSEHKHSGVQPGGGTSGEPV